MTRTPTWLFLVYQRLDPISHALHELAALTIPLQRTDRAVSVMLLSLQIQPAVL
jgi:hypothetical protein